MLSANDVHVVYGSGPVGTAVVETLLERGQRVRVVTHSGKRRHLPPQVEVVAGDATNLTETRRVCAEARSRVAQHHPHCDGAGADGGTPKREGAGGERASR